MLWHHRHTCMMQVPSKCLLKALLHRSLHLAAIALGALIALASLSW